MKTKQRAFTFLEGIYVIIENKAWRTDWGFD